MRQAIIFAIIVASALAAQAQTPSTYSAGVPISDPNGNAFTAWTPYQTGQTYTLAQLRGARSIEISLTAPGTVTYTDGSGRTMAIPYAATGPYQIPFVPARVDFSSGAAGNVWMLK